MAEKRKGRRWRRAVVLVTFLGAVFIVTMGILSDVTPSRRTSRPAGERPPATVLGLELERAIWRIEEIGGADPEDPEGKMAEVVAFLETRVRPHLERMERTVYPVVDEQVGGRRRFTEALRREQEILSRWIGELVEEAADPMVNRYAFCLRARMLTGLLEAHLEVEETVILPIFDRAVSPGEHRASKGGKEGITGRFLP